MRLEGIVRSSRTTEFAVQPIPDSVVILIEWAPTVIVGILVVIQLTINSCNTIGISPRGCIWRGVGAGVIVDAVTIGVDIPTDITDSVVVIIGVEHVEYIVVVVIGI